MKKKLFLNFTVVFFFLIFCRSAIGQVDPHFTQYYIYPLYINPAMSGSGNGDERVAMIFRNQWRQVTNPYQTIGVSYDRRTNKNLSLGFNLLNQTAGDVGFQYLSGYATAAYTGVKLGINEQHRLVFAMQAGFINRRINPAKFRTGEQWNDVTGYNAGAPTGEEGWQVKQSTVADIGAGVLYYDASPDKKASFFGGFSAFHLTRPKDPFFSRTPVDLQYIPVRYTAHAGVSYQLQSRTTIVPSVMYMRQGTASEFIVGTYLQLYVDPVTDFMFGGYYRVNDAVAPFAGVNWKDFLFGISYDFNASSLRSMSRNVNAIELSVSYSKRRPEKTITDYIRCPRM
jgi:type IX secretion system PorP/SprF family membrane protein